MPVSSGVITDPAEARALLDSHRLTRAVLLGSALVDAVIAGVLVAAGLPAAVVIPIAVVIIGTTVFVVRRTGRANDARLANFRDPVTGQIQIPAP